MFHLNFPHGKSQSLGSKRGKAGKQEREREREHQKRKKLLIRIGKSNVKAFDSVLPLPCQIFPRLSRIYSMADCSDCLRRSSGTPVYDSYACDFHSNDCLPFGAPFSRLDDIPFDDFIKRNHMINYSYNRHVTHQLFAAHFAVLPVIRHTHTNTHTNTRAKLSNH